MPAIAAAVGGVGCVDAARDPRAGCEGGACNTPHGSRRLGSYQTAPSWPQAVAVSGAPRGQLDYHVLPIDKDSELAHLSAEIRHVLGDHGSGTGRQLPCRAQPVDLGVSEQWCAGPAVEPSPLPRSPHGDAINRTWPDLSWRARFAMCSATTARGKVGSLRSQDIPWIDAGSARGALCGCCNLAPKPLVVSTNGAGVGAVAPPHESTSSTFRRSRLDWTRLLAVSPPFRPMD